MTSPACQDLEILLSLRAAGALDDAEAARVEAHLEGCAACRAEAAATAEALLLAKLPPPTEAERRALRDLPGRALDELHRRERRRGLAKRIAAGAAVAAAAAALVLAPALLRKAPTVPPAGEAVAEAVWESPDMDALWDDTEVVDLEASAQAEGSADAALAALEL